MRNEQEFLVDVVRRLNAAGIEYMLTGSMASNYWGIPRTTHDLEYIRQWGAKLGVSEQVQDIVTGKLRPKHT